jgi:ABC-type antimicrobial peptide transport system permease subunit
MKFTALIGSIGSSVPITVAAFANTLEYDLRIASLIVGIIIGIISGAIMILRYIKEQNK